MHGSASFGPQIWLCHGMKIADFLLQFRLTQKHNLHRVLFLWKNQPFILHPRKVLLKDWQLILDGKEARDFSFLVIMHLVLFCGNYCR